jgi:hypothetical protein
MVFCGHTLKRLIAKGNALSIAARTSLRAQPAGPAAAVHL